MKLNSEPAPLFWEDGLSDSRPVSELEAQLEASIAQAKGNPPPKLQQMAPTGSTQYSQLIGGCGIAAIDGYLAMKEYAAAKGLDLVELHHKGIDLQDLVSTLVIHHQRTAETEAPSRRWKR